MTTQFSVIEVADLYGFNRQTVYKRIAKGELSKNSDGKIDLAEAIRVFGEPAKRKEEAKIDTPEASSLTETALLKQQIDLLNEQLKLSVEREKIARERENVALEREHFYQDQIQAMQRLLVAPKAEPEPTPEQSQADITSVVKQDEMTTGDKPIDTALQEKNAQNSEGHQTSGQESNPEKKKGFWSSVFG